MKVAEDGGTLEIVAGRDGDGVFHDLSCEGADEALHGRHIRGGDGAAAAAARLSAHHALAPKLVHVQGLHVAFRRVAALPAEPLHVSVGPVKAKAPAQSRARLAPIVRHRVLWHSRPLPARGCRHLPTLT